MRPSRWRTGPGPFSPSLNRFPNAHWRLQLRRSLTMRSTRWGTSPAVFPAEVRAEYVQALRDPQHVHAICEEYRAAAALDRQHDADDQGAGRRIACPLLALWSAQGPLDTWYETAGGPLALWRAWGEDVQGHAVEGGHFFPEAAGQQTFETLEQFFASTPGRREQSSSPPQPSDPTWPAAE